MPLEQEVNSTLPPEFLEDPRTRRRAMAAMIGVNRRSLEEMIGSADKEHWPVPPVVRQMPANLGAWAKMCEGGGS